MRETERYKNILGMMISGKVDRPAGSRHPKYPSIIYRVNYGYTNEFIGGDGEPQDVYILGTDLPIEEFDGRVIAIYHRFNDIEDKWIVSVDERDYSDAEILSLIEFQEKYFKGELIK